LAWRRLFSGPILILDFVQSHRASLARYCGQVERMVPRGQVKPRPISQPLASGFSRLIDPSCRFYNPSLSRFGSQSPPWRADCCFGDVLANHGRRNGLGKSSLTPAGFHFSGFSRLARQLQLYSCGLAAARPMPRFAGTRSDGARGGIPPVDGYVLREPVRMEEERLAAATADLLRASPRAGKARRTVPDDRPYLR
jgi:hypothetical protein